MRTGICSLCAGLRSDTQLLAVALMGWGSLLITESFLDGYSRALQVTKDADKA